MLQFYLSLLETPEEKRTFRAVYDRYYGKMSAVALKILEDPKLAEDAVHNAFLQVIKHFEKIYEIPRNKMQFWLVSIVKNEAITLLRKQRKYVPLEGWETYAREAEADDTMGYERVVELIRAMPESYRRALEMKFLEERTDKEIARALGLTEGAVRGRIHRGRALLQARLLEEGFAP